VAKKKGWSKEDEERRFWCLAAAYLRDAVGPPDEDRAARLASFEAAAGQHTWQEQVRNSLDVEDDFVKRVYALCRKSRIPITGLYPARAGLPVRGGEVGGAIAQGLKNVADRLH
jgi:hypothetical protein